MMAPSSLWSEGPYSGGTTVSTDKKIEGPYRGGTTVSTDKKIEGPYRGGTTVSTDKKIEGPYRGGTTVSTDKKINQTKSINCEKRFVPCQEENVYLLLSNPQNPFGFFIL